MWSKKLSDDQACRLPLQMMRTLYLSLPLTLRVRIVRGSRFSQIKSRQTSATKRMRFLQISTYKLTNRTLKSPLIQWVVQVRDKSVILKDSMPASLSLDQKLNLKWLWPRLLPSRRSLAKRSTQCRPTWARQTNSVSRNISQELLPSG